MLRAPLDKTTRTSTVTVLQVEFLYRKTIRFHHYDFGEIFLSAFSRYVTVSGILCLVEQKSEF